MKKWGSYQYRSSSKKIILHIAIVIHKNNEHIDNYSKLYTMRSV